MAWAQFSLADGTIYSVSANAVDATSLLSQNMSQTPAPDGTAIGQFFMDVTQTPFVLTPIGN